MKRESQLQFNLVISLTVKLIYVERLSHTSRLVFSIILAREASSLPRRFLKYRSCESFVS